MKTIKNIFVGIILFSVLGYMGVSCKKDSGYTIEKTTVDTAAQAVIAADELTVNNEFEQAVNEAIMASSISSTTSGDSVSSTKPNALYTTINGASIDTSKINTGLIKITYYGKNADNTKGRTGEVDIQYALNSGKVIPWKTKGSGAAITFTQYEVTVLMTNKSLWLNGSGSITNVNGGLLKYLTNSDSLVDKLMAQIAFTYNDNITIIKTWTWNFNQLRTFNVKDTTIIASVRGDTILNNTANVASWGTTRSDQSFYTSITSPVIENISASGFLYEPLSGVKIIHGIAEPMTITHGVDKFGNMVSSGNPYGYKITWLSTSGAAIQSVIGY